MKSYCIALLAMLALAHGWEAMNEDQRLDRLRDDDGIQKRVLCNQVSNTKSSAMANANKLKMAFGKRLIDCTPSVRDSCDYSRTIPSRWAGVLGKRATPAQFQNKANRDIVFVLDESGSITPSQFTLAKRGAVTLSNSFCPEKLGSAKGTKQVAVVLFSNSPRTVVSFDDSHKGNDWLSSKIQSLGKASGSTATTAALRHVRTTILGKGASRLNDASTSTHVIIVTDGQCNSGCHELKKEADLLRKMGPGVQLFALGIGRARACELELITGDGKELAFGVSDFDTFDTFAKAIKEVAQENENGCF